MKRYTAIFLLATVSAWAADNEVYVDQAGNTANIDIATTLLNSPPVSTANPFA